MVIGHTCIFEWGQLCSLDVKPFLIGIEITCWFRQRFSLPKLYHLKQFYRDVKKSKYYWNALELWFNGNWNVSAIHPFLTLSSRTLNTLILKPVVEHLTKELPLDRDWTPHNQYVNQTLFHPLWLKKKIEKEHGRIRL